MQSETGNCQNCKNDFVIDSEDFNFYQKINVPPPTFCPECCLQRRIMFRNERTLYRRKNNFPGNENEEIVSIHRPNSNYTIYDDRNWWSDAWDPMDYGKDYDFSKPFFKQFKELYEKIPLINLSITNMVNCKYCNVAEGDKNSFMISASNRNEDCMYGNRMTENKQSLETYIGTRNELGYELINSSNNFKVFWSSHVYECADSMFLYNCKNCNDCIGCVNLRNASYRIFNKQYTREDYFKEKENLKLNTRSGLKSFKKIFKEFVENKIHKYAHNQRTVNSSGDNLENTSNVRNSFDINEAQDCNRIIWGGYGLRDCVNIGPGIGIQSELLYDCFDTALQVSKCFWTGVVYHSYDVRYSINCHSSNHLFGCHGLRSKEYCILNKQYTKEEYEELLPKVIQHMNDVPYIDNQNRIFKYGEFFPYDISPFAYNETIAQEYFPISKEEALLKGWQWYEYPDREYKPTINSEDLPESISDVSESVISEIIACPNKGLDTLGCTNAFIILKEELMFYKRLNIPLPTFCPNCRHFNRLKLRNPIKLWHRKCMCGSLGSPQVTGNHQHEGECKEEFETSYAPDRREIIYCEKCYQAEVY
ncbi:MAG: hypothetical protein QG644_187 [Patescibacteria group bacterium]|nr:hypothetical protein [Patescibacteria group bacterium]